MRAPLVIVQNNPAVDRLTAPVSRHARAAGYDLLDLDLKAGFSFDGVEDALADREAILLHGSVAFLLAGLRNPDLAHRLSWDEAAFSARAWRDTFGPAYLGHAGRTVRAESVPAIIARNGPTAVRPEVGLKSFAGGVHDLSSWLALEVAPDVSCFAMPPTRLLSEHRVWMVSGEPVEASQYMRGGVLTPSREGTSEAMAAARDLVEDRLPLEDIVVDVALTGDGWRIVELNCLHTSGWYAAEPGIVVDALAYRRLPASAPGPS